MRGLTQAEMLLSAENDPQHSVTLGIDLQEAERENARLRGAHQVSLSFPSLIQILRVLTAAARNVRSTSNCRRARLVSLG